MYSFEKRKRREEALKVGGLVLLVVVAIVSLALVRAGVL